MKDQEEERASSALSAKSSISTKSKKSNASAIDVKADDKEKRDRVSSVMSGRSDILPKPVCLQNPKHQMFQKNHQKSLTMKKVK